jgi:MFS family permease
LLKTHPYLVLARQRSFAAFWLAQAVSLCGDRLHQVALAVMVFNTTGSAFTVAAILAAAIAPNLLLGPLAGVAVDRASRKAILVGADLVRVALVLAVPLAIRVSPVAAFVLVFAVGCATALFLPAKTAAVADLVGPDQFDAANGATWIADSLADLVGYPVAGLIVVLLGPAIAVAFVLDAVSYAFSAALLVRLPFAPAPTQTGGSGVRQVWVELCEGAKFLAHDRALRENTALTALSLLFSGAESALLVVYAHDLSGWLLAYPASYPALETALGVGALAGGVLAGVMIGPAGRRTLVGFAGMGAAGMVLGLAPNILVAGVAIGVAGVFNLVWLVPTQSLFLSRTPRALIGRVLAIRRTITIGATTGAMFAAGLAASVLPAAAIITATGALTLCAALAGWLRPALRSPEEVPINAPVGARSARSAPGS